MADPDLSPVIPEKKEEEGRFFFFPAVRGNRIVRIPRDDVQNSLFPVL